MPSSWSPSPITDNFLLKLKNIASRHENMKIAYYELKSHINAGLLEAEEVFASLAIPLMKLVGLKSKEMAEEGRFATIITDNDFVHGPQGNRKDGLEQGSPKGDRPEGESYVTKATIAGKELMLKQQTNLLQLVHLLKKIEIQVNCHRDDILEILGSHRTSLHKNFQKAIYFISTLHSQNQDTFLLALKLFQAIFNNVNSVLVSVERSVEDLVQELAANMCNPMVEYVKGLKDDMKNGACVRFLAIVEEMESMIRDGRRELEDARKKVRMAEEGKIEAICKLQAIEEKVRNMKQHLSVFPEAERGFIERCPPHKLLGMEEEQAKDEKLLWTLLKKKRKYQAPASPMGPQGLVSFGSKKRSCKSAGAKRSFDHSQCTRSGTRELVPQNPCLNTWISLGSSPSLTIQPTTPRKRITP